MDSDSCYPATTTVCGVGRGTHRGHQLHIDGKELTILDDLFSDQQRRELYNFIVKSPCRWDNVDTLEKNYSVRWKRECTEDATELGVLASTIALMTNGEREPLSLNRIYVNVNCPGEVHFPHVDGSGVVTALYYANMSWKDSNDGETIFFESGEPVLAIKPRPGRLVIFDGEILHRGSPPSWRAKEPRFTVAFKFWRRPDTRRLFFERTVRPSTR